MKLKRVLFLIITVAFLFNCRCYFWGPIAPKCRPHVCEDIIIGVKHISCADSVYQIDLSSNEYLSIAPLSINLPDRYGGLDFNIDDNLYLGVASTGELYQVDPATGVATLVMNIPLSYGKIMTSVAFAPVEVAGPDSNFPAGTLFGAESSIIHAVNIGTGEVQVIGDVGQKSDALAFSSEGVLYGIEGGNSLHIINLETVTATRVINNPLGCHNLTAACDRFLYSAGTVLYKLSPDTGEMDSLCNVSDKTAGLATMP